MEEGRFWRDVGLSTLVGGNDADYVMVSVIGYIAISALAVGTPDCTDTVVLTAVSAAGNADPLIGAARGTAAEENSFAVAVVLL